MSNSYTLPQSPPESPRRKKPLHRRVWFWIAIAVVAAMAIGAVAGGGGGVTQGTAQAPPECVGYGCNPEQDTELNESEAAANEAEDAPAAPSFAAVGETVQFDGGITAGSITLHGVRRITNAETEFVTPPQHGSWLVIDVTVQVTERRQEGGLLVSEFDFTTQDGAGVVYNSALGVLRNSLSTEVVAGRQVRGQVAFDAPEGELLIDWSPGFEGPTATFRVPA